MYKKVLIVDDLGSINQGVISVTNALNISNVIQSQYCDDALLKIKRAVFDKSPFDLIITDLEFKTDYREEKITNGQDLVKAIRQLYPELKIIVYSVEDRLQKVRTLVTKLLINAYVCKGRKGLTELSTAIENVANNELYVSPLVKQALSQKIEIEIDDFDIVLMKQLSNGLLQDEICNYLKKENITPNSLSTIEKRLNKLKVQFRANNATHLVAIVKDSGLI